MRLCAAGLTSSQRNPRQCDSVVGRSIVTKPGGLGFAARAQRVLFDARSLNIRCLFDFRSTDVQRRWRAVGLAPASHVGLIRMIGSPRFSRDCRPNRHARDWTPRMVTLPTGICPTLRKPDQLTFTNSTRRLLALPSGVVLLSMGLVGPNPLVVSRPASIPMLTS